MSAHVKRKPSAPAERPDDGQFKGELVALIPYLRAFARSLAFDHAEADDLVQDALLRAWRARDSFVAGTSLKAWTFTILRNQFYSLKRRSWRQAPLTETTAARCTAASNPDALIELGELQRALTCLPVDLREALILVGAGGFSYGDAAAICGCPVGTIKSRVNRARRALEDILTAGPPSARGASPASQALDAILEDVRRVSGGSDG